MKLIRVNTRCREYCGFSKRKAQLTKTDSHSSEKEDKQLPKCEFKKAYFLAASISLTIIIVCATMWMVYISKSHNSENVQKPNSYPIFKISSDAPPLSSGQNDEHKFITRDTWGGLEPNYTRLLKTPVKYVIISHTAGVFCKRFSTCAEQMQNIQSYHIKTGSPDIGYNFLIGGDGNIYVGRDWDAINFQDDLCIGISFIGNFIKDNLTSGMIDAAKLLINRGVELGKITEDYRVVSHNQTYNTLSPGTNVYKVIKTWSHFKPGSVKM